MALSVAYVLITFLGGLVVGIGILVMLALYRFPGQYFDADGVRIFYRVEGEGTPVVLVHGYGVNADLNWRHPGVVRALRKDYQVILIDVRGHGRSDKPENPEKYGIETAHDVCRLLDHLGIQKAHVVGYSMGGFITIKLTAMCPDRLLSAVPCASGWEQPKGRNLELLRSLTESLDRHEGYGALTRALEPVPPPEWKVKLIDFLMGSLNDNTAMSAVMKNIKELAITEEELRNNRVPVLSLVGTRDPLGAGVKDMIEMMPCHEAVYIEKGDHVTTLLKGAYFSNLKAFLAKHSPNKEEESSNCES
ncbi:MAG: alpha/beta hydrolase [Candidatus Hydrogenedentes bacterium]|nr:alpha/beta hydrolase [Candidatus Hydrogenedentota bacterium]